MNLTMESLLNGVIDVFNPPSFYDGNYGFPLQSLYECSKFDGKTNLVYEFFEKNYLKEFNLLIKEYKSSIRDICLCSDVSLSGNGRDLRIALEVIASQICFALTNDTPDLGMDYRKNKEILVDYFRRYKKAITILQKDERTEEYQKECDTLIYLYNINEERRKEIHGSNYYPAPLSSYLEKVREKIVSFLVRYNRMAEICSKPINLEELEKCLNLEKFYFVMAKHLIDSTKIAEELNGRVHNSFIYVEQYMRNVEYLNDMGIKYDFSMKMTCLDDQERFVKLEDLKKEWIAIKNRHPEYKTFIFDAKEKVDYRNPEVMEHVSAEISKIINSRELMAEWNFVRKGERLAPLGEKKGTSTYPRLEKTKDEKNKELRERIDFFESTPYVYRIEGKNNFVGYIGYIYANGYVIFEKFYKDTESFELASENATYVMNLENFMEMSKKTKTEIMQFIKDGNTDLKRKYHTSKWKQNVSNIICGTGYDIDTIALIDDLILTGDVKKKGLNNV